MRDTSSPEYRAACEARHVLSMPKLERRREYLALVEKMRGKPGRLDLEAAMQKEWESRRKSSKKS